MILELLKSLSIQSFIAKAKQIGQSCQIYENPAYGAVKNQFFEIVLSNTSEEKIGENSFKSNLCFFVLCVFVTCSVGFACDHNLSNGAHSFMYMTKYPKAEVQDFLARVKVTLVKFSFKISMESSIWGW